MANRCPWCGDDPLLIHYHDNEWGVPVHDDKTQFEFIILESFQSGLNWALMLKKRQNFQKAFSDFVPEQVAAYDEQKIMKLLRDPGIIRNERKVRAAVQNARAFLSIQEEQGRFSDYLWNFVDKDPIVNRFATMEEVPDYTALSKTISKDLKQRGFKMVGPTVAYSHMQAVGIVNDHLIFCDWHPDNN